MSITSLNTTLFPTSYAEIFQRIQNIKPVDYAKTRNFTSGDVSYLSPYISRGFISTKIVLEEVLRMGYKPYQIEKFIQELAWRDYWQQIWIAKRSEIDKDMRNTQTPVTTTNLTKAIVEATTGVAAIDKAIEEFYETGYLHNHVRMYIAGIACNIAQNHWYTPAKWMYYHLLDADWASNALSWQWVAGTNSNKKYVANQDNINKYCHTQQKDTFLDVSYEALTTMAVPRQLKEDAVLDFKTPLPEKKSLRIDINLPTLIYNFYNIDPLWKKDIPANRILLLEPSVFEKYPVSQKSINFAITLAKENINNIQVFTGEFSELLQNSNPLHIYFKEHPLNTNYKGNEESRDWMFPVEGYHRSFFAFWKKCKKQSAF